MTPTWNMFRVSMSPLFPHPMPELQSSIGCHGDQIPPPDDGITQQIHSEVTTRKWLALKRWKTVLSVLRNQGRGVTLSINKLPIVSPTKRQPLQDVMTPCTTVGFTTSWVDVSHRSCNNGRNIHSSANNWTDYCSALHDLQQTSTYVMHHTRGISNIF